MVGVRAWDVLSPLWGVGRVTVVLLAAAQTVGRFIGAFVGDQFGQIHVGEQLGPIDAVGAPASGGGVMLYQSPK